MFDALRSRDTGSRTRIIAVTARAMSEERDRILKYGFDGYISKPVDTVSILSAIESLRKSGD